MKISFDSLVLEDVEGIEHIKNFHSNTYSAYSAKFEDPYKVFFIDNNNIFINS